jgi:hypothetical protein
MIKKQKFPVLATLLLILGLGWLIQAVYAVNVNIPWLPVIVVVIAISMIWNRFR